MSTSSASGKEVIYIDVDDEITAIIDKVRSAKQKIVALVLPKRTAVLQSVVNMKLLKRTADEAKKNIVLITSEANLLPLAANVGVHVAKTLQTKPEIPDGPGKVDDDEAVEQVDDEGADDAVVPKLDKTKPVGELAGGGMAPDDDEDEAIELGDEDEDDAAAAVVVGGVTSKAKKGKKDKKLLVPNFNRFRLVMLLGIPAAITLIVLLVVAATVLPKASIDIKTDSQAIDSSTVLALNTDASTKLDPATGAVPAIQQQTTKTMTQQVPTTGQQNNGVKATGKVTLSLNDCSVPSVTIPAGSAVSANNLTFITQEAATLQSVKIGPQCKNSDYPAFSTAKVDVIAQTGGAQYNLAAGAYSVPGQSNVSGSGTAMSGGTDDIVKIVAQADIDSATQKIGSQDTTAIKQELQTALTTRGYMPIAATFNPANPQVKTSANAGQAADTLTVTETIQYTMLGVKQSDLQTIIAKSVASKLDTSKQKILDYGLGDPTIGLQTQNPNGANITLQVTVVAGSDLNIDQLKTQVAGKKASQAESIIKQNPGVTSVDVSYSPFWVSSIPKKTSRITITVEKPKTTSNATKHQ
ncbi:MAG TPA: hypothetical protein VLH84_01790 [Patescibacteria group bacterium]|nr:hypothetical protein [Patescibacteria group bacterium]